MTALPKVPSPTDEEIKRKQRCLKRWNTLKSDREQGWTSHWRELAENTAPRAFRYLASDRVTAGNKKNQKIINSTPIWAARTLAAGMMAGITSPSRPWFRLTTGAPDLQNNQATVEYLSVLEEELRKALQKSNVYNALHQVYEDLGTFGTSAMLLEQDEEDVMRAYSFPIGQYALANSSRMAVDSVFRESEMSVVQMVEMFGVEKCSIGVQMKHANGDLDVYHRVLHVIQPNKNYEAGKLGTKGKKYSSLWMESNGDANTGFLRDAGFDGFPCMCPRWKTIGEDVYGQSPAMDALGDMKQLQLLEKRKMQAFDKIVTPPMKGPSSLLHQRTSLLPGDITYVDANGPGQSFEPAMVIDPRAVDIAGQQIQITEQRINKAFYADLWLMLSQADGQMTATEVIERREEKLLQLGPVMERLQDELLDPLITRTFQILQAAGRLPPPPEELQGRDVAVEYISIMAQAQKLLGTTAVERFTTFIGNLSAVAPQAMDKLDVDATIDEYGKMLGVPPTTVRPAEEVGGIRQQRAQQQAQQQQMEQAQQASVAAKNLAGADTEGNNALTTMLQGMGAR